MYSHGVEAEAAAVRGGQAAVDAEKETKAALVKEKILKEKLRKKGNKARKKYGLVEGRQVKEMQVEANQVDGRDDICWKSEAA